LGAGGARTSFDHNALEPQHDHRRTAVTKIVWTPNAIGRVTQKLATPNRPVQPVRRDHEKLSHTLGSKRQSGRVGFDRYWRPTVFPR